MDYHKRRLLSVRISRLEKLHLLELEKADFYKNYFDIESNQKEMCGSYCLIMQNQKIIAYRKDNRYFLVDD